MKTQQVFISTLVFIATLSCQGREPNSQDLVLLQQEFVTTRASAFLSDDTRNYSDQQLFFLACRQLRLNCKKSLELLKEKDSDFFYKLFPEQKQNTNQSL